MSLIILPCELQGSRFRWLAPNPKDCGALIRTCTLFRKVAYNLANGVFKEMYLRTLGNPSALPNCVEDYQAHLKRYYQWHPLLNGAMGAFRPLWPTRENAPASKGLWQLGPHLVAESIGETTLHIWDTSSHQRLQTFLLPNSVIISVALHGQALFILTKGEMGTRLCCWTDFRQPNVSHHTLDFSEQPTCLLPWNNSLLVGTTTQHGKSHIHQIDPSTMAINRSISDLPARLREIVTYDDPDYGPQLQILCRHQVYLLNPVSLQLGGFAPTLQDPTCQAIQGAGKAFWIGPTIGEIWDAQNIEPIIRIAREELVNLTQSSYLQHNGKEYLALHDRYGALSIWDLTDKNRFQILFGSGIPNTVRGKTASALLTPDGLFLSRPEDPSLMKYTRLHAEAQGSNSNLLER